MGVMAIGIVAANWKRGWLMTSSVRKPVQVVKHRDAVNLLTAGCVRRIISRCVWTELASHIENSRPQVGHSE